MDTPLANAYFDDPTFAGENVGFQRAVQEIRETFAFDFVTCGLASSPGAPLKWVYSAGSTSNRFKRIALSPGHGIGGIVLKTGKPMLFSDIDAQIDPREFSSYPIVFAEDLRSFCALPLKKDAHIVGVLLLAFRSVSDAHVAAFKACSELLEKGFCGLSVQTEDYLDLAELSQEQDEDQSLALGEGALSQIVEAQEQERKRISREIHDGIAQELLAVTVSLREIQLGLDNAEAAKALEKVGGEIGYVLDELHNLSVELRPSTLDHFGLIAALRSQAYVFERAYGNRIMFEGPDIPRFDAAYETQAYRICQEAILNSCKYSNSDFVFVTFEEAGDNLAIRITDHGEGFNVEHPVVRGSGCGVAGMRERAAMIGATLDITSDSEGTTVSLMVPLVGHMVEGNA